MCCRALTWQITRVDLANSLLRRGTRTEGSGLAFSTPDRGDRTATHARGTRRRAAPRGRQRWRGVGAQTCIYQLALKEPFSLSEPTQYNVHSTISCATGATSRIPACRCLLQAPNALCSIARGRGFSYSIRRRHRGWAVGPPSLDVDRRCVPATAPAAMAW